MKVSPISLAVVAVGLAAVYVAMNGAKQTGQNLGGAIISGAIDLADGALSGGVVAIGEAVGIPQTDIPYALQLLDSWNATPWYEKAALSFRISAALPLADYLRWLADSSYRPTL